ncbi:hypothetical protein [Paenibacillus lautus]|uniref:hypothetical protein n=1 Tax=Paenibacillus lautus TaxID=1401 RepID=UPI000FDAD328|nr:hypothetical protein [Paenibacillus lautus]
MQAQYRVNVMPPGARIQQIKSQAEQSNNTYPFPHFQNTVYYLPVVRVPIGLPIYRMANYRTRVSQLAHIKKEGKPENFFSNGQENQSSQQVQHELLFGFAQKGSGDSIVPIMSVLEKTPQREPILITNDGIVVNGNRRLSAMRELFANGTDRFSHVDCMVLPDYADKDDIREIEIELQMTPHTLLPYDWVGEGFAIRELFQMGMTKDKVSQKMRKRAADIDNHLLAFDYADSYLTDWLGTPGDYSKVLDKEQLFTEMAKNLKSKEGEDLEASRQIAFIITENSGNLGSRAYDYKNTFGPDSVEVLNRLASRLEVPLSQVPIDQGPQLEIEIEGEEDTTTSFAPIIEILMDRNKSKELSEEIADIHDTIKSERDDRNARQNALKRIKEANTRLLEVDLTRAEPTTYEGIKAQLNSIQTRAQELLELLDRQSSSSGANSND